MPMFSDLLDTCHPLKEVLGDEDGIQPEALELLIHCVLPIQDLCIQTVQAAHLGPCQSRLL